MTGKAVLEAKVGKAFAEKATLQGAAFLYITREAFQTLVGPVELGAINSTNKGRLCFIERLPEDEFGALIRRQASLCLVPEGMRKTLTTKGVLMTKAFLQASGFTESDKVQITLAGLATAPAAKSIIVEDVTPARHQSPLTSADLVHWEWIMRQHLGESRPLGSFLDSLVLLLLTPKTQNEPNRSSPEWYLKRA
jgi:hypothetical protein